MTGMASIYSKKYKEEIEFYPDDFNYSSTIFGAGFDSGKGYNLTEEDGIIVSIERIDDDE